jgi:hypothetical protein
MSVWFRFKAGVETAEPCHQRFDNFPQPFFQQFLLWRCGCVGSTSRSIERATKSLEFAELLRLVEDDTVALRAKNENCCHRRRRD